MRGGRREEKGLQVKQELSEPPEEEEPRAGIEASAKEESAESQGSGLEPPPGVWVPGQAIPDEVAGRGARSPQRRGRSLHPLSIVGSVAFSASSETPPMDCFTSQPRAAASSDTPPVWPGFLG